MRDKIKGAWSRVSTWVRDRSKKSEALNVPLLLPLTPEYDSEKHGVYFEAIQVALKDRSRTIRNIALTGSYGVGKSSILGQVAMKHRRKVVSISLSTLGLEDKKKAADKKLTKTNLIQKEIVKQLLYSQDPTKMPGSRYRRMTRFRFWREFCLASLLAIPVVVIFYLTGWSAFIAKVVPLPHGWSLAIHAIVFIAALGLVLGLRYIFHNRIDVTRITAGSAAIELSAKSSTYFDEYLDEIVYYFEMFKRDIVIFEDIDRFGDPHIFETLRALNTLLNGAKQLRGRNVRFIYAIKDSIFDQLGERAADEGLAPDTKPDDAAGAELARANRTKFFDLVIPVVPFITHRSARDLLTSTLGELDHNISSELVDLAARHLADMRLIKDIRNEFMIFKRQIMVDGSLSLSEDSLFAMVIYKVVHLSDFELIKLGESKLDALYVASRELIRANISEQNKLLLEARRRVSTSKPAKELSQRLGDKLHAYLDGWSRITEAVTLSRTLAGDAIDDDNLHTPDFWNSIASAEDPLVVNYTVNNSPYPNTARTFSLSRVDIERIVAESVNSSEWAAKAKQKNDEDIDNAVANREFLRHADMKDLAGRKEFQFVQSEEKIAFDKAIQDGLDSELARQLVRAGYIDRNFTLYTSTFYADRVSATAMNFLLKNVDPNLIDMQYSLTASDVDAIVRERTTSILTEKASLNISILDRLLESHSEGATLLVNQMLKNGSDESAFLAMYFEQGQRLVEFVQRIAKYWRKTFSYLIAIAPLDEADRLALVGTALFCLGDDVEYELPPSVRDYIETNYKDIAAFQEPSEAVRSSSIAALLRKAGVHIDRLSEVVEPLRSDVTSVGAYRVNRDNLKLLLGDGADLALNTIHSASAEVYARVLEDLTSYVAVLVEGEHTVNKPESFTDLLNDVLKADATQFALILKRATSDCIVDDLGKISKVAWQPLAAEMRFAVTFKNVDAYVDEYGLDEAVASMLQISEISVDADDPDAEKLELALAIISASDELPDPATRAKLVASLNLDSYIDIASIPSEVGPLIGDLIGEDVIPDEAASFGSLAIDDWSGREYAISKSGKFATFMTPTELPVVQVGRAITSQRISDTVKNEIVSRFSELTAGASLSVLNQVVDYALSNNSALQATDVTRLAAAAMDAGRIARLLQLMPQTVTLSDLSPILQSLGGEYAKLDGPTGKRPRFDNSASNDALATRLEQLGVVARIERSATSIRVNMKRS